MQVALGGIHPDGIVPGGYQLHAVQAYRRYGLGHNIIGAHVVEAQGIRIALCIQGVDHIVSDHPGETVIEDHVHIRFGGSLV